jgi:hypothetical protein
MSDARIAGTQLRSFLQRVSRISKITSNKLMSLRHWLLDPTSCTPCDSSTRPVRWDLQATRRPRHAPPRRSETWI